MTSVRIVCSSEDKVGWKWSMVQVAGSQRSINAQHILQQAKQAMKKTNSDAAKHKLHVLDVWTGTQ